MPRYAIRQDRALATIYTEADDVLDAIHWARRVLIDHARNGALHVVKVPDRPYDERDAESELRYEETEADRETEQRERERMSGALSLTEPLEGRD